jgi:hypothetical protein
VTLATDHDAWEANHLPGVVRENGMSAQGEDWVLNVYARAIEVIAVAFVEATGLSPEGGRRFAGVVFARLAALDPPLTVERLQ